MFSHTGAAPRGAATPPPIRHRRAVIALAATLAVLAAVPALAQTAASPVIFRSVRVFDGERMLPAQDVLVQGGRIARLGQRLAAPAGAAEVDGRGKTLLPGLIDSHTHTFGDANKAALVFGVTTELDMFSLPEVGRTARAEQAAGRAQDRADLYSAGVLVTVAGGHGTEYGIRIPTLASADSAQAFVDARIAEGSDYIKLVYDDEHTYGMSAPTLTVEQMRAVIAAAHRRGKLAVVHAGDLGGARAAIDAGADGLAHLFVDREPDPGFGRFVAAHHAFVVPTLTVLMSITGVGGAAPLGSDARLKPYLSPTDALVIANGFPRRPGAPAVSYAAAQRTVRQLVAARVPILAGTDAGNPGTAHGIAMHRELELLVQAGLTPTQALAAATSVIRVVVAEDQAMVLGALAALLEIESDIEVVGRALNGREAVELVESQRADVLLTDIEMPEVTGLEAAAEISRRRLPARVVILTTFARAGYLRCALDAGASGYLLKDSPAHDLANAVRRVHAGGRAIDPELAREAWTGRDPLSERERQVLRHAGEGATTAAIAATLGLSEGTVRNYLSDAIAKLGAGNRFEAARAAREKGWL